MNINKTLEKIVHTGVKKSERLNNELTVDNKTYSYQISKKPICSKMKAITVKL